MFAVRVRCNSTNRFVALLFAFLIAAAPYCVHGAETSVGDLLQKPSLNVVLVVADMDKAKEFYGEVLGLAPMAPIYFNEKSAEVFFPHATTMERFRVGTHEIKLLPGLQSTKPSPGGVETGIGIRMLNFPITDIEAFKSRLKDHGYPEPEIHSLPDSNYRFGLLKDPDGNQVEFFTYDGEGPEGWDETIHIALTVSDIEASRSFYGEMLGMTELPPITLPLDGTRKVYFFQNGPTLIKFWSYGRDLPNHAGRHFDAYGFRYIQYPVKDIAAAHDFVKQQGAMVELPPTSMKSMPVKLMFVADPDGIINEMFGLAAPE
jgi:catechol 2,3-dioxygenase-like lactoylglutathione lyase family enzyme